MPRPFRPSKMVNWFEPRMLLQTALKAVISGLFGNYADKREMQAALPDTSMNDDEWSALKRELSARDELWVDYVSDTGDGFDPTYSIASLLAQPSLRVDHDGKTCKLPRAKLLVFGGDEVYPTPTTEAYEEKFSTPLRAAFPENDLDPDRPLLYAIPGNHDWYDGLGSFLKLFCQQRWIGNWATRQRRSYFALPLPHGYWIWATDIQLDEYIDKPQQEYFLQIARGKMQAGDKVILCTAEPAWIYRHIDKSDRSYDKFRFFVETYITHDRIGCVGKTFQLAAVLTGDLHHYSRYSALEGDRMHSIYEHNEPQHYFGAGGGGAFLHLTHNLPRSLGQLGGKEVQLGKTFPDQEDSRKLLAGNLAFPLKNYFFALLTGFLYFLFFWLLQAHSFILSGATYLEAVSRANWSAFLSRTAEMLLLTPSVSILSGIIVIGFWKFTDTKNGRKGASVFGLLHGFLQLILVFAVIRFFAGLHPGHVKWTPPHWYWQLIFLAEITVAGGLLGGFLMGLYLYTANLLFDNHMNEASSSLASADYKNFLRIHVQRGGLTVYPIGIKKVTRKWKQTEQNGRPAFEGELPGYHLIEPPVFIKNNDHGKIIAPHNPTETGI